MDCFSERSREYSEESPDRNEFFTSIAKFLNLICMFRINRVIQLK